MIVDQNLPQKIETKLGGEYNIESVINDDGTQTLNITSAGKAFDRLQWKCDNLKTLYYEFAYYGGESLSDFLNGLDTSQVTNTQYMFYGCSKLTSVPLFDTSGVTRAAFMFQNCATLTELPLFDFSNVTDMYYMFGSCIKLTTVPLFDTSKVTRMADMFYDCHRLTSVPLFNTSNVTSMYMMFFGCSDLTEIPEFDTKKVTNMAQMFDECVSLVTVLKLDMISVSSSPTAMFDNCKNLTNLTLLNIKKNLQIGSGTKYGHLLTLDSLINTIKELWDFSSGTSTYTLTMSSTSKELIANVYVKLITPTEEMIANDPYIESKMPCEVCESTDEGAMLITDYATLKMWTIA